MPTHHPEKPRPPHPFSYNTALLAANLRTHREPQNAFPSIHVLGTNGKGSTATYIASTLSQFARTATYTSPHLAYLNERLTINNRTLPDQIWHDAEGLFSAELSVFERTTAAAFQIMHDMGVDVAVIEAGLGGRYDATNVLANTLCTVFTSISMDHMDYLGCSLQSIAREKFAVIHSGIPACFSGSDPSLIPLFKSCCHDEGAFPHVLTELVQLKNVQVTPEGNWFDYHSEDFSLTGLHTNMLGTYQVENAALAVLALSTLRSRFPQITADAVRAGLEKARWPGRLEVISQKPLVVMDGGHNVDGVRQLVLSIKKLWPSKTFGIVYAAMRDKEYTQCLELLSSLTPRLYLTRVPDMERSATVAELLRGAEGFRWEGEPEGYEDPLEALTAARAENEAVLICGSLYLLGWLKRQEAEK